jgi:hypothetical protein
MEVARRTYYRWQGLRIDPKKKRASTTRRLGGPARIGETVQMGFNFEDLDAAEAMARDLLQAIAEWRAEVSQTESREP